MAASRKKLLALKALNYDLFDNAGADLSNSTSAESQDSESLPTIEALYHLYDRFNFVYFDGHLPQSKIEYSNRMTCAGSYTPATNLIKLSRKYHSIFPDEIEDTLKHEMIHIIHFNHNTAFKAKAR